MSKRLYCQCLYEIENDLPRTKFCHKPCLNQTRILHERELLDIYQEGFSDELWSRWEENKYKHPKFKKAYSLGKDHAIIGDDVTSIDRLSDSEIIELINNR